MGSPTYNKQHTKTVLLCFNLKTDQDILHKLDTCGNKQGYIKRLIRADMRQHPEGESVQSPESSTPLPADA